LDEEDASDGDDEEDDKLPTVVDLLCYSAASSRLLGNFVP
jgi:hypothetical protein